jgi:hypothetical protein
MTRKVAAAAFALSALAFPAFANEESPSAADYCLAGRLIAQAHERAVWSADDLEKPIKDCEAETKSSVIALAKGAAVINEAVFTGEAKPRYVVRPLFP